MGSNWQLTRKQPVLTKRARIIQSIRAFFIKEDFLEIETPQRIPANAPELNIDAVPSADWFLHTSPELCMKRLLAAGYPRLFQLCRCWRNAERGSRHLPEYTMLEWYRADSDYQQIMTDCEQLMAELLPDGHLTWQEQQIDLKRPWPRLTIAEAFARYSDTPLAKALQNGSFDEIISLQIEPKLPTDQPVFLTEYPVEHAALARKNPDNHAVAERFELYICGMELANAFSELTDPVEQRQRFEIEEQRRRTIGKAPYPSPEPFIHDLQYLPPSAGIALGIDRLTMLLCDLKSIDEVVAFTPEQL